MRTLLWAAVPPVTATAAAAARWGLQGSGNVYTTNYGYESAGRLSTITYASSGWVIGQAGTAGHCANANPDICTSIAHTSDGGQTWSGLPAPSTGGPQSATGVTGPTVSATNVTEPSPTAIAWLGAMPSVCMPKVPM